MSRIVHGSSWRTWITAGVSLAVASFVLSGCGLSRGEEAPEGEGDDTLTVWFPGSSQDEIALMNEELVPAFEEEHDVDIEIVFIDWGDMSPRLNAAFAGNVAPDVFGHGPAAAADFVINERVVSLTDRVEEWSQEDHDDLGSSLDDGVVEGEQYLIPLATQGQLIAYRTDLFEEAGLDPENPPTTWKELRAAAEQLTVRDGDRITRSGLLLGTAALARQQSFMSLLVSLGGEFVDENTGTASFDSPEGVEALEFFTGLYEGENAVATDLGDNFQTAPPAQQPLVLGSAAMTLLSANAIQQIITANPDLPIAIMQPPAFEQAATYGGTVSGLFINADSPRQDLAWEFIQYMVSPGVSELYAQTTGAIPVRNSAAESQYVKDSVVIQASLEASDSYVANPNVPGWTQVRDEIDVYLEQALNGQITAEEALAAAAQSTDEIIAQASR